MIVDAIDENVCLAMGFFDCVHKGHLAVFGAMKELAQKRHCGYGLITFDAGIKGDKEVFCYEERIEIFKTVGIRNIVTLQDSDLKDEPMVFLDKLFSVVKISGVAIGADFRFGRNRGGDKDTLRAYLKARSCPIAIVDDEPYVLDGRQIEARLSTGDVKALLKEGKIGEANALMAVPYHITGKVEQGRQIGRRLGFPTANIAFSTRKMLPKYGVYAAEVECRNERHKAVVNIGARPTYNDFDESVEAHLIGFDGDIYGEDIVVFPRKYIREDMTFSDEKALAHRITLDIAEANNSI